MTEIVEKVSILLLGLGGGHLLTLLRFHVTKDKRALRCEGHFCEEDNIINFEIRHTGNKATDNIAMQFHSSPGDAIRTYQIYTRQRIICDRLNEENRKCQLDSPQKFTISWTYMNPGDHVLVQVKMARCNNPMDAHLDIDGKEVCVSERRLKAVCK